MGFSIDEKKWLIIYLGLLIVVAIGSFLFQSEGKKVEEKEAVCKDGAVRGCTLEGCKGVEKCINGQWNGCTWERICTPGEKVPCSQNACSLGYKICNKCGTAFSECIMENPPDLKNLPGKIGA